MLSSMSSVSQIGRIAVPKSAAKLWVSESVEQIYNTDVDCERESQVPNKSIQCTEYKFLCFVFQQKVEKSKILPNGILDGTKS